MDLRKESATPALLDQHNSLLYSKSYLYTHRYVVAHTAYQTKKLLFTAIETITENHNWLECRGQQIMGSPDIMDIAPASLVQ